MNPELQELKTALAQVCQELADARQDMARVRQEMKRSARRARLSWVCALFALGCMGVFSLRPVAFAQAPDVTLASLQAAIVALQQKTAALTQTGTPGSSGALLSVSGDNVQIVDGSGSTVSKSGLGNLTIGYNGLRGSSDDVRTGSHNLILGDQNNYSSHGGLVAGKNNTITNQYASVGGGYGSRASGFAAYVGGGYYNKVSGDFACISGGKLNTAGGNSSSVSGGYQVTSSAAGGWAAGGGTIVPGAFGIPGDAGTFHAP